MNFDSILDIALASISRRIKEAPSKQLAELSTKNSMRSSFAVTSTFSALSEHMKLEFLNLIQDLSNTKISSNDLFKLRHRINLFIDNEFKAHEEYLVKIKCFEITGDNFSEFITNEKEDIKVSIELKILVLEKKLRDQHWTLFWDISKIVISAIIGGVIGAFIKNWIA
ncbi:hypothetical protein [Paenibacillus alvei]|uniref:Uncharacterized protein n=1 Tax=Paenibacillus alvei TaxID=44250 RepID=A0AAP7DL12_PAEAL|nr:hypothetical protein [Paenibacillus alvei]NOJ73179.1 hypothetical protein [Paenibacillus alvei]